MSRYGAAMATLLIELEALAPHRICGRTYADFSSRMAPDLAKGIYTLLPGGITAYPYEASDDGGGGSQTNASEFRFVILGQGELPERATGADIDTAEFEMIAELEALANLPFDKDPLATLRLLSISQSQQLEAPYFWIHSEWSLNPWS